MCCNMRKIVIALVAISCFSLNGCIVEDDGSSTSPTPSPSGSTSIGTAQVTVVNAKSFQLTPTIDISVGDAGKEVSMKEKLGWKSSVTLTIDLYEGKDTRFKFTINYSSSPYTHTASYTLKKDTKYTVILHDNTSNSNILLENTLTNPASGKAYIRGVNLGSYGIRAVKSSAAGDVNVDLTVGPYSDNKHYGGDYKAFTALLAGSHVVQQINYTYSSNGDIQADYGSKEFLSGKAYTIITITNWDSPGGSDYLRITH